MRCFTRFCHSSLLSRLQIAPLSSFSKSSKPSQSKKTQQPPLKNQTNINSSLFNYITQVLGTDHESPPSAKETHLKPTEEFNSCKQDVCRNAQMENVLENSQVATLGETDVSPVVHGITEIVRDTNSFLSMEERLENSGFQFEPEVVDKVLKRCFKVPHLALRFFNWVKLRQGFYHTTETYNALLSIAGEAKEFGLMDKLEREMEINSCEKDIKTWTILLSQYGKAKLIGKALTVFEKMRICGCEPDMPAYKMMIRSLSNAGKGHLALEFYKEMADKDMVLDLNSYKMVLNCAATLGDVDAVHRVTDDMIRISHIPKHEVYGCVLKCFCVSGRIKEALEFTRYLKNKEVSIDQDYFNTLVKGLCRSDRISDALEIVDIMKRIDLVDEKVYEIIINGYLRKNDLSKALLMFQRMKESGYLPTVSTYTELMQRLFKLKEYERGCKLYDEMLEKGVQPDCAAITAVVAGHVRRNRTSEAWRVFRSMDDKGIKPTWKSYSIFIKELCKVSRTDQIFKVLNEMQASKTVIGDEIFDWVISCMEKKGEAVNVEKVKQMQRISKLHSHENMESSNETSREQEPNLELKHKQTKQERMDAHSHLVEPVAKAYNEHDLQETCQIFSSLKEWRFILEALEKCTVQFTPELVLEILRNSKMQGNAALHIFSWVGKQAGYSHSTDTYNMAIKVAGSGKDFEHMRNLFNEMRRKGYLITADTWTVMIMQYGRAGLTEIALRVFGEMKASGCNPTDSTYKYLIICLCGKKGRKVDDAIKLFEEMIHAGFIPDKELVETYIACLFDDSKLQEARSCMVSLQKVGFSRLLSYSMYIRALCRIGKVEEAVALIDDEVGEDRAKLEQDTYGSIVHGLLQMGRLEEALNKVELMKQAGVYPTGHVYTSLMVHFFKEKQIGRGLEIFEEMRQQGHEPTVVTYSALIRGYMKAGKVTDAWDIFYRMKVKGPAPDFKTYTMFINSLCEVGKSEEALKLLSEMSDSGIVPSNVNLQTISYGLNREGKHDLARLVSREKSDIISSRKF